MQNFSNIDMDRITNNIWLGNISSAKSINNLKKLEISKILTVIENVAPNYKREDNFWQKIVKVADSPDQNIIRYFGECIGFIEGDENVLVHCMGGSSRSPTIVIAYIMWRYMLPFNEAFEFVNSKRPYIFPNDGFKEQLKIFEALLIENEYDLSRIDFNSLHWDYNLCKYYMQ